MADGLPRHSHYGEALALDTELARMQNGKQADARPSMREWSPEVELLAAIFDRMNAFIQTQSEKNLRLKPWPTPITAKELLRQSERKRHRARLMRLVEEAKARNTDAQGKG